MVYCVECKSFFVSVQIAWMCSSLTVDDLKCICTPILTNSYVGADLVHALQCIFQTCHYNRWEILLMVCVIQLDLFTQPKQVSAPSWAPLEFRPNVFLFFSGTMRDMISTLFISLWHSVVDAYFSVQAVWVWAHQLAFHFEFIVKDFLPFLIILLESMSVLHNLRTGKYMS